MPMEERKKVKFDSYYQTLQLLNESTDDYLFLCDMEGTVIRFANDHIARRYPLPLDDEHKCSFAEYAAIIYERDAASWAKNMDEISKGESQTHDMIYRIMDREGNIVWISCRGKVLLAEDGRPSLMLGRISDTALSGRVDFVTGLFLGGELQIRLKAALKAGKHGVLMILGVDRFKNINTRYGRGYGNFVLKRLAAHLENCVEVDIPIYRLDGDHFAVNFENYSAEQVQKVYHVVQRELKEDCTLSAGAVTYPIMGVKDTNLLYDYAERALDRAKQNGRNHLEFFAAEDYEKQLSAIDLTEELRKSVKNNCEGFYLVYQPQVSLNGYDVVGAEALLRFKSPYRGIVPPDQFIGILEQSGMIVQVGNWILDQAITQCAKWRKYTPAFRMSINLSYVQLEYKDLSQVIYDLLERENLPGEAIILELTESMQLQDYTKYNQLFYQWGKHGIQISMDDFGTGYSSLGYLKSLAIDEIKVDRCFVSHIDMSAYNYRLLSNILELAKSSQIRVVCEGVETLDELLALTELEPEEMQGFYFSKPLEADVFAENYIFGHGEEERWKKNKKDSKESKAQRLVDAAQYKKLLDQLDEVVYVIDEQTFGMYYMNSAAQRLTGAGENYVGRKCYQLIEGKDVPCSHCQNGKLHHKSFITRQSYNEYLGTRMLIREKRIKWNDHDASLAIGMDMSVMDTATREMQMELYIEDALIDSIMSISEERTDGEKVRQILQKIGEFYGADRCYIFVYSSDNHSWSNICEWCDRESKSRQIHMTIVPEEVLAPWVSELETGKDIIVRDVSGYKEKVPELFELLHAEEIHRLMVTPMKKDGKLFGFVGVDNPKNYPYDQRFFHKITPLLVQFLSDNRLMDASKDMILDMTSMLRDSEILTALQQGMWSVEVDENTGENRMYVDRSMKELLGAEEDLPPEEYFHLWYDNIDPAYRDYVDHGVAQFMESGKIVELQYPWHHPTMGTVDVRCIGVVRSHKDGIWTIQGCHCILENIVKADESRKSL